MKQLPASTSRLLSCSQVITSVASVIKELIENSLDAGANNIDVKLEKFGFDRIEVRDNGQGICKCDVPFMAQRHYTSKITDTCDLSSLETYGFRGEALGSLCAMSDVTIVTKTRDDNVGMQYSVDHVGLITSSIPSHLGEGTSIIALNLFKSLPVRKQYYNTTKKKKDELKRVEDLVMSFGIIHPGVRFTLRHDKCVVWQKSSVVDHRTALLGVLGPSVVNNMKHIERSFEDSKIKIQVFLPNPECNSTSLSRSSNDRCFVYINKRPVVNKQIEKLLKKYYSQGTGADTGRYPISFVSIDVPTDNIDVNIEPNKTQVLLHNKDEVIRSLKSILDEVYGNVGCDSQDSTVNQSTDSMDNSILNSQNSPPGSEKEQYSCRLTYSSKDRQKSIDHTIDVASPISENLSDASKVMSETHPNASVGSFTLVLAETQEMQSHDVSCDMNRERPCDINTDIGEHISPADDNKQFVEETNSFPENDNILARG